LLSYGAATNAVGGTELMSSPEKKEVVVIGGGITGLATADRLLELAADRPIEVTLLEASDRLGGIIRTEQRDGFILEAGPDAFISEKPEALALSKRLGLTDRLIETNPQYRRSFVVRHGKLRPIPEGFQLLAPSRFWPFATSGICGLSGKLRMAGEVFLPQRWDSESDETLASFVRRRFGAEALERLAQPLVGGIYTADPEKLSLRATMPRFLEMERKHGSVIRALVHQRANQAKGTSGARYSLFLSFDHGMQVLTDELAKRIPATSIQLNARVKSVSRDADGSKWICYLDEGESIRADAICLALPAHRAADLLRAHDTTLADELTAIPFASSMTINLAFRREDIKHPLDGFGFVVPLVEKRSIIACSFSSVKFPGRAPEGHVLLRAFAGGALQPEVYALNDGEMLRHVIRDVTELLNIGGKPLFASVQRWPNSMPQYHLGHLERVARISERVMSISYLAIAGNAFGGAGIPDCIRSGEAAAEKLLADLERG
jgi:oxygen-dependent protoporphyrinogen oxidase